MIQYSLAIPTFNRSGDLKILLDSILVNLQNLNPIFLNAIEILVSNNASTDNTHNLLNNYKKKMPCSFKVFTQKNNIGFDKNWFFCFKKSRGTYVHVVGDDDVMMPGFLEFIFKNKYLNLDLPLISIKTFGYDIEPVSERPLVLNSYLKIVSKFVFLKNIKSTLTFISAVLIKKDKIKELNVFSKFIGTAIIHVPILLALLKEGNKFGLIDDYFIAAKRSNLPNFCFIEFLVMRVKEVFEIIFGKSKEGGYLKKIYFNQLLLDFVPLEILRYKIYKPSFATGYKKKLFVFFSHNWRFWLFSFPVMLIPVNFKFFSYFFIILGKLVAGNHRRVFFEVFNRLCLIRFFKKNKS